LVRVCDRPLENQTNGNVSIATTSSLGGRRFCREEKAVSVEQITGILKQAELGTPVQELSRIHGVSEQSFYRWKKIYGGMEPSEARELHQLRKENVKLNRPVADLSLDKAMVQDVLQKQF